MFVKLPDNPMPAEYMTEDCGFVFRNLHAGESCSLVGIGSVGKSNLLQHLTRDDVQAHHVGADNAPYLLTVYLDPHTLIQLHGRALDMAGASWAGYELMLSRLHRTLLHGEAARAGDSSARSGGGRSSSKRDASLPTLAEQVAPFVDRVRSHDAVTRQSGLRHIEDALYTIFTADDRWRVAFLLDEISGFDGLPAAFFQSLRGLRDQYKGRVAYITASRTPIEEVLGGLSGRDYAAMREFTELFRGQTRYISPLDEASAAAVIDRFIARYKASFDIYERGKAFLNEQVTALAGGHVGLMRRSFKPAVQYLIDGERGTLMDHLLRDRGVASECETILRSLTEAEGQVLYHAITERRVLDMDVWDGLFDKHIVVQSTHANADFQSPLLGEYATRNPGVLVPHANVK